MRQNRFFFDRRDYELLQTVDELKRRDKPSMSLRRLADPYLHPHGIKELASRSDVRIAYAALELLNSLEVGRASERLVALRSLRDEVLHSSQGHLRRNTARVLLSIVKDLLRAEGDQVRELELAHDFHTAAAGRPRVVRSFLERYHLLEMPEEWNQVAFDDHVHDANTKGRKSPTHLIMDAWIKGIRVLTVVYYNHVRDEVAAELLEAAEIMGVAVRIAVEVPFSFRGRLARLIWIPRGFLGTQDFLEFLAEPPVRAFMEEGRAISDYRQRYVLAVLQAFNERHRPVLAARLGLDLPPITQEEFLALVGTGQPSILHLAEVIHQRLDAALRRALEELRREHAQASPERRAEIEALVAEASDLDALAIWERFLRPEANPDLPDPNEPGDDLDAPPQLRRSPAELAERLHHLPSGYRITLNLSDLETADVLEILYTCQGRITHLEIFNLKDYAASKEIHAEIDELRLALNASDIIALKRIIRRLIDRVGAGAAPDREERLGRLNEILSDVRGLLELYSGTPLSVRIGSDSAGRSHNIHGMGLVLPTTLPPRARRELTAGRERTREILPVHTTAVRQVTYIPPPDASQWEQPFLRFVRRLPGLHWLGHEVREEFLLEAARSRLGPDGNLATLGGLRDDHDRLSLAPPRRAENAIRIPLRYLNTNLIIILKVLLGLLPAFLTFALTKDWWVLAYLGALIWFGITGLRNILQSVLGGGGIRRSPLLRWNDHVSWGRVADSLMYTGFSVPLLDYAVKAVLLDRTFHINTSTAPVALYSVIALVNGLYISSHTAFRGLPRSAVFANLFRSILSIPIAIGLNALLVELLGRAGFVDAAQELQKWAAILSKFSSDLVAGFIEGSADRLSNLDQRLHDYRAKLSQLFSCHGRLELLHPDREALAMLASPKELIRAVHEDAEELERVLILNALDLLYFWMYQPRARSALRRLLRRMSPDERLIFLGAQSVLAHQREVATLLVDGLLGKNFQRPLSFFLVRSEEYLRALRRMVSALEQTDACELGVNLEDEPLTDECISVEEPPPD